MTVMKNVVRNTVAATFDSKKSALRKAASAKAAIEQDLEVIVEKAELENISSDQIHEISFDLSPDFIKIFQSEDTQ